MKIIWSPLALERVEVIGKYIAKDNVSAALRWTEAVFDKVKRLKTFLKSGRVVPELMQPHIREIIYKNYRIVYRIEERFLSVLTVRHGSQILPIHEIDAQ